MDNKKKDNPVASIEFTRIDLEEIILFSDRNRKKFKGKLVSEIVDEYLQNAVETDKEEPKDRDGNTMVKCVVCGKYHTPICSDDCMCAML